MFYRFTLAAVVAATTLTGCAAFKSNTAVAPVSQATQTADAPAATAQPEQPVQTEQSAPAEQPVQTTPVTAPGAVTESSPEATTAEAATAPEAPVETASAPTPAETATPTAPAEPAKEEKVTAAQGTAAVAPFSSGPTQIDVSHIVTRADDGSSITLTIDGTEAGILKRGEKRALFVEPGKHKVGGYVQTLFGLGRVTIPAVEITTVPGKVKHVAYSVTRTKPAFAEAPDTTKTPS
ncbi:hypothetical protein [Erwinia aphidicola]|uniref:hypothetical protein n=1 Tax=Erwinia aphidicola TaxID=68334 RepID=UPI003AFAC301